MISSALTKNATAGGSAKAGSLRPDASEQWARKDFPKRGKPFFYLMNVKKHVFVALVCLVLAQLELFEEEKIGVCQI